MKWYFYVIIGVIIGIGLGISLGVANIVNQNMQAISNFH